jgi:hypothetical protein
MQDKAEKRELGENQKKTLFKVRKNMYSEWISIFEDTYFIQKPVSKHIPIRERYHSSTPNIPQNISKIRSRAFLKILIH